MDISYWEARFAANAQHAGRSFHEHAELSLCNGDIEAACWWQLVSAREYESARRHMRIEDTHEQAKT